MNTAFRLIEVLRIIWGTALLTAPRTVLGTIHRVDADRRAIAVTRILGARHLVQAGLSGVKPSPQTLVVGIWVDGIHSLTALGLAMVDRHRARAAVSDAVIAATWALFGAHDLSAGRRPPRLGYGRTAMLARYSRPYFRLAGE